jgi:DNA modification methylase
MTFCDPPYGVNYANSAKDKLRGKNRPILNDNLGEDFGALLYDACVNILAFTKGAIYICMSSSELDRLQKAFREAGGKWSTFVIWAKNTFTLGRSDYQRQYEPILYGWRDGTDHYWCGARDQGDVWFFEQAAQERPASDDETLRTRRARALEQQQSRRCCRGLLRRIGLDPHCLREARTQGSPDGTRSQVHGRHCPALAGLHRQGRYARIDMHDIQRA